MEWISVNGKLIGLNEGITDFVYFEKKGDCVFPTNYKRNVGKYISIKRFGFCKLHRLVFYLNANAELSPEEWINKNKNKVIMHSCDNTTCINPKHLSIGTQIDNIKDRVRKFRSAYHENNGNTDLIKEDIDFMRFYYKKRTLGQLADFFNVSKSTVSRICRNKSWMPLPIPPKKIK